MKALEIKELVQKETKGSDSRIIPYKIYESWSSPSDEGVVHFTIAIEGDGGLIAYSRVSGLESRKEDLMDGAWTLILRKLIFSGLMARRGSKI